MKEYAVSILDEGMKLEKSLVENIYEPPRDKTNNVAVRPAKIQISLGIRCALNG